MNLFAFLRQVRPFDLLPSSALTELTEAMTQRDFDAHVVIYQQGRSRIQELSVIYQGEVSKYFINQRGEKEYAETFGPGDTFGAISIMLNNHRAIRTVRTLFPTLLYTLPEADFLNLCQQYEEFADFFTQQFGKRMLSHGYATYLLRKPEVPATFESSDYTFTQQVSESYSLDIHTCAPVSSIEEVAKIMTYYGAGYAIVKEHSGKYKGIITEKQIIQKVVAKGYDPGIQAHNVMRSPIPSISSEAYSYEAILQMFKEDLPYLLVKDDEEVKGIISLDKLLYVQAKSPFLFVNSLMRERSVENLRKRWQAVPEMIRNLLERGTKPEIVNQIVSATSDAITYNLIKQAINELGTPPVGFVYMALGSEGRREQTLSTDQDNAIIFEDVTQENYKETQNYFVELGKIVSKGLDAVGFPYCEGELMASNAKWTLPLTEWMDLYNSWIQHPHPEHVVHSITFFDCRSIYGETQLLDKLKNHIFEQLGRYSQFFFSQLTKSSLEIKAPLSFFGNIQATSFEKDKKGINVKHGMLPIVDFARIFSLFHHISQTNTGERLQKLMEADVLSEPEFHEVYQAYYFLMRLRLDHQTQQILNGDEPDNILNIKGMSKIERVTLKEVFKIVEKYQKKLHVNFGGVPG